MVEALNKDFVNAWVLAKDLPRLADASPDENFGKLCATLKQHYTYPVDSIVVSPGGEVLEQRSVEEAMTMQPKDYVAFLEKALAAFRATPSAR